MTPKMRPSFRRRWYQVWSECRTDTGRPAPLRLNGPTPGGLQAERRSRPVPDLKRERRKPRPVRPARVNDRA